MVKYKIIASCGPEIRIASAILSRHGYPLNFENADTVYNLIYDSGSQQLDKDTLYELRGLNGVGIEQICTYRTDNKPARKLKTDRNTCSHLVCDS
ncbi:MAG: hypothetical protein KAS32_02900 [Candidatus Peribacteraceae bacterium]|nr:hypothetical protein [Candidatus Peribacteraceae bacterium]